MHFFMWKKSNVMWSPALLGRRVIDPPGQIHCDESILLTVI